MELEKPPEINFNDCFAFVWQNQYKEFLRDSDDQYYYWNDIKCKKDAPFKSSEENWALIKAHRFTKQEILKFGYDYFKFYITRNVLQDLHHFDLALMDRLHRSPFHTFDQFELLKNSLLEEAVASSQVEGAAVSTEVAMDMLKTGRKPTTESEQMIFNNFRGINFMLECKDYPINFKTIFEVHFLMTADTEAESCSGTFRNENLSVTDHVDGEIMHTPPNWHLVEMLMGELCEFINDEKNFIHPIVKASIIHFMFVFIRPFMQGNGRTARALFYWFLSKKGYSLIEDMSISRVILESRKHYLQAFLRTELDENDLNYFISYSINNIRFAYEKSIRHVNGEEVDRNIEN